MDPQELFFFEHKHLLYKHFKNSSIKNLLYKPKNKTFEIAHTRIRFSEAIDRAVS